MSSLLSAATILPRHRWLYAALPFVCLFGASPLVAQQPAQKRSDLVQARLDEAIKALESNRRFKELSPEQIRGAAEFTAGNVLFAMLHEMGHALIKDMGLPVLGREEDAADSFASVSMLKVGSEFSHGLLVQSAKGWYYSARQEREQGDTINYYDEHSLDAQRAYNIVCLMVGSNSTEFKDLADQAKMPTDRQDTCAGDYSNASWSWDKALEAHVRAQSQPRTKVTVVYGRGKGTLGVYQQFFKSVQVTEVLADLFADRFVWRGPFTMEWKTCGFSNAEWQFGPRTLTVCYELADDFAKLYAQYGDQTIPAHSRKTK
jgi:hypothetical protein